MNKSKLMSIILSGVIGSQLILGTFNSAYALEIPKDITSTLSDDMKNLLERLQSEENPAAIREIIKEDIFDRNMPIGKIESIMQQITNIAIGSISAPGYNQAKSFIISPLMNLLWPSADNDYIWKAIRPEVQKMINNSIEDYDFGLKTNQIGGIRNLCEDYIKWLDDEQKSPSEIQRKFTALDSAFVNLLGEFKSTHKVEQLPLYAITSNFHLILASDMVRNAEVRGYDTNTINGYKSRIKERITEYTNYVDQVYKEGLSKRIEDAKNVHAINGAGASGDLNDTNSEHAKEVTARKQWNFVNEYKRFMQLHVLDFTAMWQYMDPDIYDKNVNFQESREIYSDLVGRKVGVTDWNNISFPNSDGGYVGEFVGGDMNSYDRIDRIRAYHNRGAGDYKLYDDGGLGGAYGFLPGNGVVTEDGLKDSDPIIKVAAEAEIVTWGLRFNHKSGAQQKFGSLNGQGPNKPATVRTTEFSYPDNKLSGMYSLGESNYAGGEVNISGLVFGFRPESLTPANNLSEESISVFSSQKYLEKSGFSSQIEHILGGNAMKTSKSGESMTYKLNSSKEKSYKVRYRISAKDESKITLYSENQKIKETSINETTTGSQGEYGKYEVVEGGIVNLKQGKNSIKIENSNGGQFSISNIELVPLTEEQVKEKTPVIKTFDFSTTVNNNNISESNITNISDYPFFGDPDKYIIYKINVPEDGLYNIKFNNPNAGHDNSFDVFKILNLTNNTTNQGDKIQLVKGENKIKITPKDIQQEKPYVESIELTDDGYDNRGDKYSATFLRGEGFRNEGSKIILEDSNSYADFKVNYKGNWTEATVKINGQGEFNIKNLDNNENGRGHDNFIVLNGYNEDILRITSKKLTGFAISPFNIERNYKDIIGYN